LRKVRNGLEIKELKIQKWMRFVRITEMEYGDNFRSMTKFISWNQRGFFIGTLISGSSD
jgi:hypothetical protein